MMARRHDSVSLFIAAKLPILCARLTLFFALFCAACLPAAASSLYSNWVGDPSIGEARLI